MTTQSRKYFNKLSILIISLCLLFSAAAAVQGQHSYLRQRVVFLIYTTYIHPDGSVLHQLSDEDVAGYIEEIEEAQDLIWRNSGFKYMLDGDIHVISEPLSPNHMNNWAPDDSGGNYLYWTKTYEGHSLENDLHQLGYHDYSLDGVIVSYAWKVTAKYGTGFGGGTVGIHAMGDFMGGAGLASIPLADGKILHGYLVHEYLHQVEGVFIASDEEEHVIWSHFEDNETPPASPAYYPETANLHVFQSYFLENSYQLLDIGVWEIAPDDDEDGVPSQVVSGFLSESVMGTSDYSQDTDGDGLTDLEEMTADVRQPLDPLNADTDGDGVTDEKDGLPLYDIDNHIQVSQLPTADGYIEADEHKWTAKLQGENPDRFSADISIESSGSSLFISASVIDDYIYIDQDVFWSDGLFIKLDLNNDGFRIFPNGDDFELKVGVSTFSRGAVQDAGYYLENYTGIHTKIRSDIPIPAKCLRTAKGYDLEIEIPLDQFPSYDPRVIPMTVEVWDGRFNPGWNQTKYPINPNPLKWSTGAFMPMIWSDGEALRPSLILEKGQKIFSGTTLIFEDKNLSLSMQGDGNLVLYRGIPGGPEPRTALWASSTSLGTDSYYGAMQGDGNLVIYRGVPGASQSIYSTMSASGSGDYFMGMDNKGRVSIYRGSIDDPGEIIWSNIKTSLSKGTILQNGEMLKNAKANAFMVMQGDGNLIVYEGQDKATKTGTIWKTGTKSTTVGKGYLNVQTDGNLVLREGRKKDPGPVMWRSGTSFSLENFFLRLNDTTGMPELVSGIEQNPGEVLWTP